MIGPIAWLSSSSAEISRARSILRTLTPGGVIDELGFLVLQGAFAAYFYPAITTPMTRARYLIFVPAIYRYLEQSGKAVGRDVDRLSRDLQYELLKVLASEPGAIGKEAGRNVVRPPSDIYWSALAELGLATQRVSETSYHRRLADGTFRVRILKDDDDSAHPEESESLWDESLRLSYPVRDGAFPPRTTFRLRRSEATLLAQRYEALNARGHYSLVTHLVSVGKQRRLQVLEGLDYLWQIPALPPAAEEAANQARYLSLFARGATLQYHRMLIEKKRLSDSGADAAFVAWWNYARDDLSRWDIDRFFVLIQRWGADRRPLQDREFIRRWTARCVAARSGTEALNDADARGLIRQREDRIRPGKQRLRVDYQLKSWNMSDAYPTDVHYQLEYRHPVGRRFAEDILAGLEGDA